ncbi:hypothetical protein [Algoriphagus winogradskyi]|uniref:HNH endonuclease n=1 Tax=Algoriphagus winogradskyi TaxID=237017 RepID=A0ABY1NI18_9BACT|nr:hypothetical protein [Algoriphagus winogradskyi]SMP09574.1 hypothetical protein SAMN06265367_101856 [Algoriphagus winogradskyi]
MSRPYHRGEINRAFERVKALLHFDAMQRGGGKARYIDSYTGEELWGGDRYDYDHIFPSELIHSRYKDKLTDTEIAEIVNIPENIAVTLRSINQSKGKKDPELWIQDSRLIISTKIKFGIAAKVIERAKIAIEKKASQFC